MAKRFFSQLLDRCEAKAEQLKTRWAGLSDHGQVGVCLTGVTGICNVLAAVRRGTLGSDGQVDTSQMAAPNLLGALTYWDLISTMCVLALVIPNFSRSTTEANFSAPVNAVLSVVAFGVYAIFLTAQMGRYRSLYTERESLIVAVGGGGEALENLEAENNDNDHNRPVRVARNRGYFSRV